MSDAEKNCQKPQNLKDRPEQCSPEQIRECHGNIREHPCTEDAEHR